MSATKNSPTGRAPATSQNRRRGTQGSLEVSEAEVLPQEPPPAIMRMAAWGLIALFVIAFLASVLVHIPETVRCSFVLVPENGADPIQSPLLAVVQAVKVAEGQEVPEGAELFVLRSDEIWAWQTQLKTTEEDLRSSQKRSTKMEEYYAAQLQIKKEELQQMEREVAFRRKHAETSSNLVERNQKLANEQLVSEVEMLHRKLALAESEKDLNVAEGKAQQLALQQHQLETERARQRADEESEMEKLRVRIEALKRQLENCTGDLMSVRAPYRATVISLAHRNAGGVVQHGSELCQLARAEGEPQAHLLLQQAGVPKLATGQKVRLFFEAFPYQRYGTISGKLEWISPAAVNSVDGQRFTGRAALDRTSFGPRGQERPLRAGMKGAARLVVGSRTLIEYAFEPLRQLRELSRK